MLKIISKAVSASFLILALQSPSFAEEEIRQKNVSEELNYLKSVVSGLEERVKRLEKEKYSKSLAEGIVTHESKNEFPLTNSYRWKDKNAWMQIKEDMPEGQVEAILGHPIRIDEMGKGFKKLFYHGEVIGSGQIGGNIEIYESRVVAVHPPVFQ